MANFELDIHMPTEYKKFLMKVIALTESNNKLSFFGSHHSEYALARLDLGEGENNSVRLAGPHTASPFHVFCILDLLVLEEMRGGWTGLSGVEIYHITPIGYRWHKYHSKGPIKKWFVRNPSLFRDFILFFAFLLSLSLTILEILNWMGLVTKP